MADKLFQALGITAQPLKSAADSKPFGRDNTLPFSIHVRLASAIQICELPDLRLDSFALAKVVRWVDMFRDLNDLDLLNEVRFLALQSTNETNGPCLTPDACQMNRLISHLPQVLPVVRKLIIWGHKRALSGRKTCYLPPQKRFRWPDLKGKEE